MADMGTDTAYTLSKGGNPNYVAQVVEVTELVKLEGLDNLRAFSTGGFQALVSKDTPIGTRVAVFPAGSRLSDAFASKRNLFRNSEKNADPTCVGYLEDQARVKAIRLRGHRSDALALTVPAGTPIGMFDTIDGDLVVWKYEPPVARSVKTPKADVWKRVESKFLPEHYDTLNYFRYGDQIPQDVWVTVSQKLHGTSVRLGHVPVRRKPTWFERTLQRFGVHVTGTEYDYVAGSRKVIKDPLNQNQNHYYSYDMWTEALLEVKDLIPKNIVLYGELTGWTKDGSPIQKDYTYTAAPNSADLYIYRVSVVTEDAQQYDLPWKQMVAFCEARGLKTVPLLWEGLHFDFEPERWLDTRYWPEYPQAVRLSKEGTVDEGVVIRADLEHGPVALKAKSPVFLRHESTLLDEGTPDMESEN